jgi:hypothetical protein
MKRFSTVYVYVTAIFIGLAAPSPGRAAAQVVGIDLVNSIRIGSNIVDSTYRVRVQNTTPALTNARAIATTKNQAVTNPFITVTKSVVKLGDLPENSTITSNDTVTVRASYRANSPAEPLDDSFITWRIVADSLGAVPSALAQLEASSQIPVLDRSADLSGSDIDLNGVRDDIDKYINSLPDSVSQKSALRQEARAISSAIIAGSQSLDQSALKDVSAQIGRAVFCVFQRYDPTIANRKITTIEKFVANTRVRFDAYDKYNSKVSGTSSRAPVGDSCDNK